MNDRRKFNSFMGAGDRCDYRPSRLIPAVMRTSSRASRSTRTRLSARQGGQIRQVPGDLQAAVRRPFRTDAENRHKKSRSRPVRGLDSTLALLVTCEAVRALGLPPSDIVGITMPGMGTTDRTYQNALPLMTELGVTLREIPIRAACALHYGDIGHDPTKLDVTFENVQARERTQILMDVANQVGGLVVGTGDLSELALGWLHVQRGSYEPLRRQRRRAEIAREAPGVLVCRNDGESKGGRGAQGYPRHTDQPGAPARRSERKNRAEDRGCRRPVRAARFLPLSRAAQRLYAQKDSEAGDDRV